MRTLTLVPEDRKEREGEDEEEDGKEEEEEEESFLGVEFPAKYPETDGKV